MLTRQAQALDIATNAFVMPQRHFQQQLVTCWPPTGANDSLHAAWEGSIQRLHLFRCYGRKGLLKGSPKLILPGKNGPIKAAQDHWPQVFYWIKVRAHRWPNTTVEQPNTIVVQPGSGGSRLVDGGAILLEVPAS